MKGLDLMAKEPWELLADSGIKEYLTDTSQKLTDDFVRMLFLELFQRIKTLETENHTLKTLLFLQNFLEEETFKVTRDAIQDYLNERDEEKAREALFWANSGVSFVDWVNFVITGKFRSH